MAPDEKTYDVIVIGAGSTGENLADIVVRGGLSALLVESELVGGECSYWACMPSKTLLRGSEALAAARSVQGAAAAVTGEQDVAATLARRTSFTHDWDDSSQADWVQSAGIDLVRGTGRLAGERRVVVTRADGSELTVAARQAVAVCTGSVPRLRRSRASPTSRPGRRARPPVRWPHRAGCWSSAAATSAARWPPPGSSSARR